MLKIILPKLNFKVERWKWNKEYRVYVSTLGNFKDEFKKNLPIKINAQGYVMVRTRCGMMLAHRLVMFTFKPIPGAEKLTVDHLNHNKRENTIYNLEWVTKKVNLERAKEDQYANKRDQSSHEIRITYKNNLVFHSYEEAYAFVFKKNGMANIPEDKRPNIVNIKDKIKHAIRTHEKYCDGYWDLY